ncbi:MAG TPA: hypothetical protein VGI00_03845 [Streptosporangiaceae bacterium]|jgi:hypothetical protein
MVHKSARSKPDLPVSEQRRSIRIMGNLCPWCEGEGVRHTVRAQAIGGRLISREIVEEVCRHCVGGTIG